MKNFSGLAWRKKYIYQAHGLGEEEEGDTHTGRK